MKEDDDLLSGLFESYKPQMTSQNDFVRRLDDRLAAVEVVKNAVAGSRRRSRVIAAVALVVGILAGSLTTMMVYGADPARLGHLLSGTMFAVLSDYPVSIASVAGGAVAVAVSMSLYHLPGWLRMSRRSA